MPKSRLSLAFNFHFVVLLFIIEGAPTWRQACAIIALLSHQKRLESSISSSILLSLAPALSFMLWIPSLWISSRGRPFRCWFIDCGASQVEMEFQSVCGPSESWTEIFLTLEGIFKFLDWWRRCWSCRKNIFLTEEKCFSIFNANHPIISAVNVSWWNSRLHTQITASCDFRRVYFRNRFPQGFPQAFLVEISPSRLRHAPPLAPRFSISALNSEGNWNVIVLRIKVCFTSVRSDSSAVCCFKEIRAHFTSQRNFPDEKISPHECFITQQTQ